MTRPPYADPLAPNVSHGRTRTPTYQSWQDVKAKSTKGVQKYEGTTNEWKSFEEFAADMGQRPFGMSLQRLDETKPYCKSNCAWLPLKKRGRKCGSST